MTATVRSEWTKLRTVPSTAWLLLATVVLTVAVGMAVTAALHLRYCTGPCPVDTVRRGLSGVQLGQVAVVSLAVLAVSNEYATRMVTATVTATPRRLRVLAAKLTVVTGTVLVAGALGALGALLVTRLLLPGRGFTAAAGYPPPSLADGPTLRAVAGTVLYLGLLAVLSVGVAMLVRDTAAALTVVLGLLYVAPMIAAFISDPRWQHRLHRYAPMDAGLAVQYRVGNGHIGPWAGLGVFACYAAFAVLAGALAFTRRDV